MTWWDETSSKWIIYYSWGIHNDISFDKVYLDLSPIITVALIIFGMLSIFIFYKVVKKIK